YEYIYDGQPKEPKLMIEYNNRTLTENTDYTAMIQNNTEIGQATVEISGRNNYYGSTSLTFTIKKEDPKDISGQECYLNCSVYVYDGQPKEPEVTVQYNGQILTKISDYTVAYQNNINAGEAKVQITGKNNYFGTISKSFTIKKAEQKITAPAVEKAIKSSPFQFRASTNGGGALTFSSSNKKIATVTKGGRVTVKAYGKTNITIKAAANANYNSASIKTSVSVVPQKAVITGSSLKSKKIWNLKWKVDKTVTGYQLCLSENKSFKGTKKSDVLQKTISRKKAGKISIGALQRKKNYYIRIRAYKTVGKKKYYGSWSKIKRVVTK
ncbi:MAG: Ig-like domain-containing protein, partial [Lachnospiraceae bacterium]|nr:Ig-like domain-containing protein [Lachnospiraceae bacterium]